MTQDGGNASPFQGDREGFRALPLKSVESAKFREYYRKALYMECTSVAPLIFS